MIKLGLKIKNVLDLTLQGKQQKQIADEIGISTNTVKCYRRRLYKHFSVSGQKALRGRFK
jgi:DNA-binding CsgD family transcriptional regulator